VISEIVLRALRRRKEIYEALHPETRSVRERGGPGRGNKTSENVALVSFTSDTSAKTGKSKRSVEMSVALAAGIVAT
jgi:hypothetical protein